MDRRLIVLYFPALSAAGRLRTRTYIQRRLDGEFDPERKIESIVAIDLSQETNGAMQFIVLHQRVVAALKSPEIPKMKPAWRGIAEFSMESCAI